MASDVNVAMPVTDGERAADLAGYRMRRRVVGLIKRMLRWEFWPPYVFYPPVVACIVYLGVRFRSWTLFTASNPAIPAGGFIGESKYDILSRLRGAAWALPAFTLLPPAEANERVAQARAFMEEHRLRFPVVLKPDAGQRGSGVSIVRTWHELEDYLAHASFPVILQEYISGLEFGVFYYRYPDERRGKILSITEKQMPILIGDGQSTLEELILADDRAVCMADFYLRKNASRIHEIPMPGERIQLVEIGTHCRGAIFLDGRYAITPALEEAIQRIAYTFDGFYFGRFDIRVPSVEDLMAGRNLKVIELNGVTSEATHIYDPNFRLFDAYRVLLRQWRIAFEIGGQNQKLGARAVSPRELAQMIHRYRFGDKILTCSTLARQPKAARNC